MNDDILMQAQAKLQCLHCKVLLSAINPSMTQRGHIVGGGCPAYKAKVEAHRGGLAETTTSQDVSLMTPLQSQGRFKAEIRRRRGGRGVF